jgi:hypothetical protein
MYLASRFKPRRRHCALAAAAVGLVVLACASAPAAVITSADIVTVPKGTIGSGNGTLDLILLTESAGGATNSSGGFNGDNANTHLPTGVGATGAEESYITSFGELRDFFRLNFPDGSGGSTVNQIVVMVDVNETGGPQSIDMEAFNIWLNPSVLPAAETRNDPAGNDITSAEQNGTNDTFFGGTLLASLDGTKVLGQIEIGAGFPDKAIFTGIDPFSAAYTDADRFLLHWISSDHDNGGESVFVSGAIGPDDIVPEPSSGLLLMGAVALAGHRAHRNRR